MNNVLDYLEISAKIHENKIAVIDESGSCTYNMLRTFSRNVGSYICENYFKSQPIIVFMDKGIDSLIAFLGIAYSGNFYSLLNPDLPKIRLKNIYSILQAPVIITNRENIELAKEIFFESEIYNIESIKEHISKNQELINSSMNNILDTDPLYINFTSGSTGIPKGVTISHGAVVDFINVFTNTFEIENNDIIGNQAPFDFDVSVKDIYSSIKVGATLVIIPKKLFSQPAELINFICDNNVTTLIWAVSAICLVSSLHGLDYRIPKSINKVLFSGEVMPIKHLNKWMESLPNATFVNLYGPTEITCNCTYHIIDKSKKYEESIPIGRPFPNRKVFLLDDNNNEILDSELVGEICVKGTSLGLGYYNCWEESNKKFIQNPLNRNYRELIYRTGDLAKYDIHKNLFFVGRKDLQVKYRGHRIELEEIEKEVNKLDEIEQCCCIFDQEQSKLYCFYIGNIEKKEIYLKLKDNLPIFMIPNVLRNISRMPLNKNGKIDRQALLFLEKGGKKGE